MPKGQVGPEPRTTTWLANRIIPVPHGEYSAEALLTMIFSSRDLPGDTGSRINAQCDELKHLIQDMDVHSPESREQMMGIIDHIQGLTDSKMHLPVRSKDAPPAPGEKVAEQTIPGWHGAVEAPSGSAPGIFIIISTISWMRGDDKRKAGAIEALSTGRAGKSGNMTLKKSPRDFITYCLQMQPCPVDIVVDWIWNAMKEDGMLKVSEIYQAIANGNGEPLMTSMREWGLENDEGVIKGSKAASKAGSDPEIKEKLKSVNVRTPADATEHKTRNTNAPAVEARNPVRDAIEDGKRQLNERDKVQGSAAAVMKGMSIAYTYLHKEEQVVKMGGYMEANASEKAKAIKPLLKTFDRTGSAIAKAAISELVMDDKMPIGDLVSIFAVNDWRQAYDTLTTWMVTIGPRPPWVDEGFKM